jgi:DNA-binding GntR family transcriptional regulator
MESDEMKYGQKLKLGDDQVTARNIQEVQASNLGDAPEAPLLHRQRSGHLSTHYIFIASYSIYFSWSVYFCFQFSLVFLLQ